MLEGELDVKYGAGRTIFVDHCNDLWAEKVPNSWIQLVLEHCGLWPRNIYVFQTKNPARYIKWVPYLPPRVLLGCTIETNRDIDLAISKAPAPVDRAQALWALRGLVKVFVTIEPIMDFDVENLGVWLLGIRPAFVNIGADSKGHKLPEPSKAKILELVDLLNQGGIEIREKHNLERLL
jgi:hypothetical protein